MTKMKKMNVLNYQVTRFALNNRLIEKQNVHEVEYKIFINTDKTSDFII